MKMSCGYCGIVEKPHQCPKSSKAKWNRDNKRGDKQAYRTAKWQRLRAKVLLNHNYICLWSFYVKGEVVPANTVHHIVEVLDDSTLTFDENNLIPLSSAAHSIVHDLYKEDKTKIQILLRKMKKSFAEGDRTLKKFENF